jgi:hypothetical protein
MPASVAMGRPSSMMNAALRNSGCAPPTARSFTVPYTASEPMSPPGNTSGFTTKESVVNASRTPFTSTMAWSSRRLRMGLPKAGRNRSRSNSALSLPPLPWPSSTVCLSRSGSGQLN